MLYCDNAAEICLSCDRILIEKLNQLQIVTKGVVQFTMSRIIVSFKFLGDLQNYTFLESLEPTEPEK